jgi:hypothetical protein
MRALQLLSSEATPVVYACTYCCHAYCNWQLAFNLGTGQAAGRAKLPSAAACPVPGLACAYGCHAHASCTPNIASHNRFNRHIRNLIAGSTHQVGGIRRTAVHSIYDRSTIVSHVDDMT